MPPAVGLGRRRMQPVAPGLAATPGPGHATAMKLQPLRRRLLCGAALLPAAAHADLLAAFTDKRGSGRITHEERELGGFTALEVGGAIEVTLEQGRPPRLLIDVDDNLLGEIVSEINGETLKLRPRRRFSATHLRLVLQAWKIDTLEISGASTVEAQAFVCKTLQATVGGASHFRIPTFTAERLALEVTGASRVAVGGRANDLALEASGASVVDLSAFEVRRARAELSGASVAQVWVADVLQGQASGASSLRYRGDPALKVERSGGASVSRS